MSGSQSFSFMVRSHWSASKGSDPPSKCGFSIFFMAVINGNIDVATVGCGGMSGWSCTWGCGSDFTITSWSIFRVCSILTPCGGWLWVSGSIGLSLLIDLSPWTLDSLSFVSGLSLTLRFGGRCSSCASIGRARTDCRFPLCYLRWTHG